MSTPIFKPDDALPPFPIREFPDRGAKWLLSHPPYLRHLLRVAWGESVEQIDFDRLRPMPAESLSESLRKQLADLIFTAPLRESPGQEVTIFILVEHQSTPSRIMSFRVRDQSRRQEIETMNKSMAQQLLEEGRALGIKEGEARGEARGEVRGRQRIMANQLRAKFGDLPPGLEERLQRLSIEELDQLAVDLIYAQSLEELKLGAEE